MSCTAPVGGGDGVVVNEVAMVSDNAAMATGALSSFLSCTHAGCSAWLSYQKTRGTSRGVGGWSRGWKSVPAV